MWRPLRVLVEPVHLVGEGSAIVEAYGAVRRAVSAGRRVVVVAQLPGTGARLVVYEDGSAAGTLGNPALDDAARMAAVEVFTRGTSSTSSVTAPGTDLFFGLYAPPPRLIVFGATHVGMPLVAYATVLGWRVTVIDARERFATRERFPDADELLVGNVGILAEHQRYDGSTYAVIVTHDYKFELPDPAGPAREGARVRRIARRAHPRPRTPLLPRSGRIDEAAFDRVHIPVGLDIGARTAPGDRTVDHRQIVAVRAAHA